jgi:MFS transporter, DHA2 family, methylenomycin A resistance protein
MAARHHQSENARSSPHLHLALAAMSLGFVVVQLDVSVVNVALERLGVAFGSGVSGLQWVVNAYTMAFAALLLTAGALGDRFGSRRVFIAGFVLFTSASLACGLAPSLGTLIVARAIQGVGAATLVPSSLALLNHSFTDSADRARAVGIWTGAGGLAVAAGPLIGGVLVGSLGWRSIFLVNIPIGAIGVWLAIRYVEESPRVASRGIDLSGQLLAIVALCALAGAIIEAGPLHWSSHWVWGGLAVAVVAAAAFVAAEARSRNPMLPLALFADRRVGITVFIGLLINFAFYGLIFVMSLYFQQVQGYTPFRTGLAFLPLTALVTVVNVISGRLTANLGPRAPLTAGLFIGAMGMLTLLPVRAGSRYATIVAQLILAGAGLALAIPPMTTALLSSVERGRAGIASGVLNASRQLGGVLGVAVFGLLVASGGGTQRATRAAAFVHGLRESLVIAGGALLVGWVIGLVTLPRKKAGRRATGASKAA